MTFIEKRRVSLRQKGFLRLIFFVFGLGLILFAIVAFLDARQTENWLGQPAIVQRYETEWSHSHPEGGGTVGRLWVVRKSDNILIAVQKIQEPNFIADFSFLRKNILNIDPLRGYVPGREVVIYSSPDDQRHLMRKGASWEIFLVQILIGFIFLLLAFWRK